MTLSERDDHEVESLEAIDEEARLLDRGTAESAEEAAEEGLAYSPPEQASIEPGGEAGALPTDLAVPDADLLEDVLESLAGNPATEHLLIRVVVSNGTVTLRGRVASSADAEEALVTALAVSGVDAVEDELDTGHGSGPSR